MVTNEEKKTDKEATPPRKAMSVADQRQLWVNAHGMCSNPDCRRQLIVGATDADSAATTGQHAHVVGHSEGGPRGISPLPQGERETYSNMILLCGDCHALVDGQPNTYTVGVLYGWKAEHEAWVRSCMMQGLSAVTFEDLEEVTDRFAEASPQGSTPEVAPDIKEKAANNKLTDRSTNLLTMGVGGAATAGAFIHDIERSKPKFGERLRAGFLTHYYRAVQAGKEGDDIFFDLVEVASKHSMDFQKQAAGLAVLGYLFTTCELFDS